MSCKTEKAVNNTACSNGCDGCQIRTLMKAKKAARIPRVEYRLSTPSPLNLLNPKSTADHLELQNLLKTLGRRQRSVLSPIYL